MIMGDTLEIWIAGCKWDEEVNGENQEKSLTGENRGVNTETEGGRKNKKH